MGARELLQQVERSPSTAGGRTLRFTDDTLERGEVVALWLQLVRRPVHLELEKGDIPETWRGWQKYVHLVHFLQKHKCDINLKAFYHALRYLVLSREVSAVWGVLTGCMVGDDDLVSTSLLVGNVGDVWTTKDDCLSTDGLTLDEGLALDMADREAKGEKALLGAIRLDPGSWPAAMREAVDPDFFLALCHGWTQIEADLHDLLTYHDVSPTEVDSDSESETSCPSTSAAVEDSGATLEDKIARLRSVLASILPGGRSDGVCRARASNVAWEDEDVRHGTTEYVKAAKIKALFAKFAQEFESALGYLGIPSVGGYVTPSDPAEREHLRRSLGRLIIETTRKNDELI